MKKTFFLSIFFLCSTLLFSQNNVPEELYGLWEAKDRYVFFEQNQDTKESQIVVVLKMFYGWYYDRASEPLTYKDLEPRTRNDATSKEAQHIYFTINNIPQIVSNNNSAYEIQLNYSKHQKNIVPLVIYEDKIFLDFFTKNLFYDENNNPIITANGFWRGNAKENGLLISEDYQRQNIPGFYVNDDKYFDIRFWKSTMEFEDKQVYLEYENQQYLVPKHLISQNTVYACVPGRRIKIRNVVKPFDFIQDDYYFNQDKTVMIPKQEPYLIKIADKKTVEDLMSMIKKANVRRKPPAPPLFPPKDLDWHWDLILEAQKYNPYVQKVRQHQAERGYFHNLD